MAASKLQNIRSYLLHIGAGYVRIKLKIGIIFTYLELYKRKGDGICAADIILMREPIKRLKDW